MASEVRPGVYAVTTSDGHSHFVERDFERWWIAGQSRKNLPRGWTLGSRIDDLLRDAERYRWLEMRCLTVLINNIPPRETDRPESDNWEINLKYETEGFGIAPKLDLLIDAELAREKEE